MMRILQISQADIGGGAEKVAFDLFRAYRRRGNGSWLAVKRKVSDDPDVFVIPQANQNPRFSGAYWRMYAWLRPLERRSSAAANARRILHQRARDQAQVERELGWEEFHQPGSHQVLHLPPELPDIVHAHNLHGGYFDLRILARLAREATLFVTMHDAWLLSGHCSHSFECERWKFGCGQCPDLSIYPAIGRDSTAYNWERKKKIYARTRLRLATPCQWLLRRVEQSMLAVSVVESRIIPYGTDLTVFSPADKQVARRTLDLPADAFIILFTAQHGQHNPFKDYATLHTAVTTVSRRINERPLVMLALGAAAPPERLGHAEVRHLPYERDPQRVANFYQAADVYVHAARVDTFPNAVLEALACGTPVVASAVGGIPEQVDDGASGFLVAPADVTSMAARIEQLICDPNLQQRMSRHAREAARARFDLERSADSYLDWYRSALVSH
jgi:glycosyltransferase involved in cell wall biosynthesis